MKREGCKTGAKENEEKKEERRTYSSNDERQNKIKRRCEAGQKVT